jgi:hypothetical protein
MAVTQKRFKRDSKGTQVRHKSDTSQTQVRHKSDTSQTQVRHRSDTGQTQVRHRCDISHCVDTRTDAIWGPKVAKVSKSDSNRGPKGDKQTQKWMMSDLSKHMVFTILYGIHVFEIPFRASSGSAFFLHCFLDTVFLTTLQNKSLKRPHFPRFPTQRDTSETPVIRQ